MKNTKIDPSAIIDLINKYPNDMELGKKMRAYFLGVYDVEIDK
jgi:ABC-type phosphate transport system auxiliary subunit